MRELYFKNLKLEMGMGGRFMVRLVSYIFYGSLAAATVVLLFAELEFMKSAGVFLFLFLMDRLIHADYPEEPLAHLSAEGRVNLDYYLAPSALAVLEKAVEKTYFLGGDFFLWALRQCLMRPEAKEQLVKFGVRWRDLDKRAGALIKEERRDKTVRRRSKKEALALAEQLVKAAYHQALAAEVKYIKLENLFLALFNIEDEKITALRREFDIIN